MILLIGFVAVFARIQGVSLRQIVEPAAKFIRRR